MRSALVYVALVLVLALAASAAAQEPSSVPTWQQCTENPYLTPRYPGWKPDAETELTADDFDNCADDDCYKSLLQRAINELIHQRAEIANLKRQLREVQDQQKSFVITPLIPDTSHITLYRGGKYVSQQLYVFYPKVP